MVDEVRRDLALEQLGNASISITDSPFEGARRLRSRYHRRP